MVQTFDTDLACEVGIAAASLYDNICRELDGSRARKENFHDGQYWVSGGVKSLQASLPCLTVGQVKHAVEKLVDGGYIKTGNFSETKFDRTMWYTTTQYAIGGWK